MLVGFDPSLVQEPFDLGSRKIGVEHQAGCLPYQVEVARFLERLTACGRASVLPDDRFVAGDTGALVPQNNRLTLIGDADRSDGLIDDGGEFSKGRNDCLPDLLGVVLDPTGLRKMLGELSVGEAEWCTRLVNGERANAGGAGVDTDHDSHTCGPYRSRAAPAAVASSR